MTKTGPQLDAIVLTVEDVLSWDIVADAQSYSIYVNELVIETSSTTYTIVALELLYGNHTLKVVASADGFISSQATITYAYVNENAVKLDTPVNLAIDTETNILTWDSVDHAIGYRIILNSETIDLGLVLTFDLSTNQFLRVNT